MSELNFKPATGGGHAGDKSVPVPALNAGAIAGASLRGKAQAGQRRRLNSTRLALEDTGFRLFRIY
jgi:hypothetical protein